MGKQDRKEFKEALKDLKVDFARAVQDKKRWIYSLIEIAIIVVIILADYLTKKYIYGHCLNEGDIILIKDVLRFTAVENTGASFGIFKDKTTLLTIISSICSLFLVIFIFYSYPRRNKLLRIALIMITGGAIGNIIDRIALGYVRDFVYFELIDFAVFNVADSFLTVGTILLLIYVIFFFGKEEEKLNKEKLAKQISAVEETAINDSAKEE
ncbi:MAG TPA: signal peptidase II [Clostridia bacterium]|nr:signal peptidase II [Clostridia bacterium]